VFVYFDSTLTPLTPENDEHSGDSGAGTIIQFFTSNIESLAYVGSSTFELQNTVFHRVRTDRTCVLAVTNTISLFSATLVVR
jgi:hypothetical protein